MMQETEETQRGNEECDKGQNPPKSCKTSPNKNEKLWGELTKTLFKSDEVCVHSHAAQETPHIEIKVETAAVRLSTDAPHLCDSAASPDSKLTSQLCYPLMHFLSPTWMWEELRFCPARLGEPATQLMFSLIWVGWLTPPGWAESMFLSHKMSGKIKTSQEIKYIKG